MFTLLLQPLHRPVGEPEVDGLAASLERGALQGSGLSLVRACGPEGERRVECRATDPVALLGILLAVVRSGRWAGALSVAPASPASPGEAESALPDAVAQALLRRAARSSGRCALDAVGASEQIAVCESALQLLGALERRRSESQQEAGRLVEAGASQREAAAVLEVTQQAVHDRLRNGLWHETRGLAASVAALLVRLDAGE